MSKTTELFLKVLKHGILNAECKESREAMLVILDTLLKEVRKEAFEAGKQEVIDNAAEYLDQRVDDEPIRDESHD